MITLLRKQVKQSYSVLAFPENTSYPYLYIRRRHKSMEETKKLSCIDCSVKKCNAKQNIENNKPYPGFCASHNMDVEDRQQALNTYMGDEKDLKIMRASAEIEHDYYCQATRVEETIRWAKKLGAKKIGIASCVGLLKESHLLAGLLREYGFEVYGVGCKIGEVPKTEVGIPERCEEVGVHMCNPILQAQMLCCFHGQVVHTP